MIPVFHYVIQMYALTLDVNIQFANRRSNHLVLHKIIYLCQTKYERKPLLGKNTSILSRKTPLRRSCDKHTDLGHSGDLAGNEQRRVVFPSLWCPRYWSQTVWAV